MKNTHENFLLSKIIGLPLTKVLRNKPFSGTYKGSRPEVFCRKVVLKIFGKFTGRHPWRSPNLVELQTKDLQLCSNSITSRVFYCDPSENFQNSFLTEHLQIAVFVFIEDFADIILIFHKRYSQLLEQILHDENKMILRKKIFFIYSRTIIKKLHHTGSLSQD